ncbi:MAG: hypothetical protein RL407_915, partial [Bacteroidota bacterium]
MKTNPSHPSRRTFLANSAKAGLTVGIFGSGITNLFGQKNISAFSTGFTQQPLAY